MKAAKTKNEPRENDELKSSPNKKPAIAKGKINKKKAQSKKAAVKADAKAIKETTPKQLTVADLAKIEKKKAKKQAQKLKKQNQKLAESTGKKMRPPRCAGKRERDPDAEAATVFVGNLPINTKRVQIIRLFEPYGTVNSIRLRTAGGKLLFKHKQRKSAGSLNAYVVLQSAEVAQKALTLNGTEFKENHLRVTLATQTGAGDGDKAASDADAKRCVFVGNLKYSATEKKLHDVFSSCGEIESIRCLQDGTKGCQGVAYVNFKNADAVGLALELNQTLIDDRPINVERYSVKKLGAKQQRDAAAASAPPVKKSKAKQNALGAKKRLDKKQTQENGKGSQTGGKKKSEYRGVKVEGSGGIKKSKAKPKKKSNNQLQALAKKIAPKPKT
ncbi:RNA-binding protein 34 [Drosophila tropicalis]|uniref:RNA-binding protein 34 n=1 Tax=Drosophila tropicalis TaxID=46794 RepID=UPI0035AC072D